MTHSAIDPSGVTDNTSVCAAEGGRWILRTAASLCLTCMIGARTPLLDITHSELRMHADSESRIYIMDLPVDR